MKPENLLNHPFLLARFGGAYTLEEIGDGNLNYVFLARAQGHQPVVVKHAPPYIKCLGAEYALTQTRLDYEIEAMREFNRLAPGLSPELYGVDAQNRLAFMEYVEGCEVLRAAHLSGKRFGFLADRLGGFAAATLFGTSNLALSSMEKSELERRFDNVAMRSISEDYIFTFPFISHPTNAHNPETSELSRAVMADTAFLEGVAQMKYAFSTRREALLHGDLHTGSVLVGADRLAVIDAEFAFVGPMGFDTGAVIANLLLAYAGAKAQGQNGDWALDLAAGFWRGFERHFLALWSAPSSLDKAGFMARIFADTLGFAGCKTARRILGAAGVAEIRGIQNDAIRARAETLSIRMATALVKQRNKISDAEQLIEMIKSL